MALRGRRSYIFENWLMKLKCPLLLKPLATIVQENSQSFYPSEPFRIIHFTMRHPVCMYYHVLPFSWNAGSCLAAPLEALVDKSAVTTMTLKIWVHNEYSDFMSRKKGWWLETASYCSWDCSFFDIIASVLYRVVRLRFSISYCQQKKWLNKSSIL